MITQEEFERRLQVSVEAGKITQQHADEEAGRRRQWLAGQPPEALSAMVTPEGPGSELKSLLATFGIHASPTCKCNSMARKMNDMESKEPGWCLAHIEEIVDVMEETAKARKLPFLRTAGKLLVKKAVKNWQKKATGK